MPQTNQHLFPVALKKLKPTQITVGFSEVQEKQAMWERMKKKDRTRFLDSHWFPAVRGPESLFYIVDHHHLGRALLNMDVKRSNVVLLQDLSTLSPDEFWVVMEHKQWVHPYDAKGKRKTVADLPTTLEKLVDDPYRSLAGEVRRAGGFPKDATPFAEFLWADFFRRRIPLALLRNTPADALTQALSMCHNPEASHLPGWTGLVAPVTPVVPSGL